MAPTPLRRLRILARKFWGAVAAPGTSQRAKAKLTAKSYILQEAEAASRAAKIRWCRAEGIEVSSLQHDGIMMGGIQESDEARVATGLSQAATAACGYGGSDSCEGRVGGGGDRGLVSALVLHTPCGRGESLLFALGRVPRSVRISSSG